MCHMGSIIFSLSEDGARDRDGERDAGDGVSSIWDGEKKRTTTNDKEKEILDGSGWGQPHVQG